MAAKKKSRTLRPGKQGPARPVARKPKFIEIEGHQLTGAMYADYVRCVESRYRTNPKDDAARMGLDDFLAGYRPSTKIKGQLSAICHTATRVGLAIGAMDGYTFWNTDPASVRAAGCDLLKRLAIELGHASKKLSAIAWSVEAEEATKLQDWLAPQDEQIARIVRGAEVTTHG